jgi:hypothetical protein
MHVVYDTTVQVLATLTAVTAQRERLQCGASYLARQLLVTFWATLLPLWRASMLRSAKLALVNWLFQLALLVLHDFCMRQSV